MKKFIDKNKKYLLIVLGVILVISITSGTIAFYNSISSKNNTFEVGEVKSDVSEEFDNIIKKNVSIINNGNVKEYIRVFVNIYYKDTNGVILSDTPVKDIDYSLSLSNSSNWLYNSTDNFYYYKLPINPNENTDILINECKELISHIDKRLNVDILSQSIQAEPVNAVISSWHVNVTDDNITLGS